MQAARFRLPPAALALVLQLGVYLAARQLLQLSGWNLSPWLFAFGCGMLSALLSHLAGLARWWLPIQLLFLPALLFALTLGIPPAYYLAAFLLLLGVYWSAFRAQVPLYLSSRRAGEALAGLLPQHSGVKFLDLGSGTGGLVLQLARARPDVQFNGVESAPLPFLVGRLRALRQSNCRLRWGDFWEEDLGGYDVVYAYLSPVPMAKLWGKVRAEMRPGSLFVSSSFEIPGTPPQQVIEVNDLNAARLYLWRL